jgi:carbonic anhydrase
MIAANEALKQLKDGNHRFVSGTQIHGYGDSSTRREELIESQTPFAVILGCSDSRVPAELVFDQGLGDLFVIRVAGNIVASSQVGSVEFAAEYLGVRLVVVIGHSQCGAIEATLAELQDPTKGASGKIRSIVNRIRPAIEELITTDLRDDPKALSEHAVRANVRHSADHLRHGSPILEQLIENEGLKIVGAEYSIETGVVDFFAAE